jgi:hypothetical protein
MPKKAALCYTFGEKCGLGAFGSMARSLQWFQILKPVELQFT